MEVRAEPGGLCKSQAPDTTMTDFLHLSRAGGSTLQPTAPGIRGRSGGLPKAMRTTSTCSEEGGRSQGILEASSICALKIACLL